MDLLIKVTNQQLRLETQISNLIYGTKDFIRLVFSLTGDWDGLRTCAQFHQGNNVYNKYLDADNSVYFPPEIQPGTCSLLLYGTDGSRTALTDMLKIKIDENQYITNASSSQITQTLYEQLIAYINSTVSTVESRISSLEGVSPNQATVSALTAETERAMNAEAVLSTRDDSLSDSLLREINRASAADNTLAARMDSIEHSIGDISSSNGSDSGTKNLLCIDRLNGVVGTRSFDPGKSIDYPADEAVYLGDGIILEYDGPEYGTYEITDLSNLDPGSYIASVRIDKLDQNDTTDITKYGNFVYLAVVPSNTSGEMIVKHWNPVQFNLNNSTVMTCKVYLKIVVPEDETLGRVLFRPMIRKAGDGDATYQRFIPTNSMLYGMSNVIKESGGVGSAVIHKSASTANGDYARSLGYNTVADGDYQHVSGKYNVPDSTDMYAEIIGNGTSENARSNARTLDWEGNEVIAGSLAVGGNLRIGSTVLTEAKLTELINIRNANNISY